MARWSSIALLMAALAAAGCTPTDLTSALSPDEAPWREPITDEMAMEWSERETDGAAAVEAVVPVTAMVPELAAEVATANGGVSATLEELLPMRVVGTAEDEQGALQWMQSPGAHCDLMVIDVFLKSGTGLEVLRQASRLRPEARRVVLTNYATPDMRRRCAQLGADRVFDKSAELEELLAYCAALTGPDSLAN